jgi:dihydropteroate synthase
MGILNVTPDSFYDGGRYRRAHDALRRAEEMVEAGVDLIDVGGESTRPGADPVPVDEELRRTVPVVRGIRERFDVPVSVDTTKAVVARRAIEAGAEIVNDISGLRFDPEMADAVAGLGAGLVVMHIRGTPRTMQRDTAYDDLAGEVRAYLERSLERAEGAGIDRERVVVDPGIGFGKRPEDNFELIRSLGTLREVGRPVLVGPSRKSFLWKALGTSPEEALEGTVVAAVFAWLYGADILRVHDVAEVRRGLIIARRFTEGGGGS